MFVQHRRINGGVEDGFLLTGLGNPLPKGATNEGTAPKLCTIFSSYPINGGYKTSIGNAVTALNGLPGVSTLLLLLRGFMG